MPLATSNSGRQATTHASVTSKSGDLHIRTIPPLTYIEKWPTFLHNIDGVTDVPYHVFENNHRYCRLPRLSSSLQTIERREAGIAFANSYHNPSKGWPTFVTPVIRGMQSYIVWYHIYSQGRQSLQIFISRLSSHTSDWPLHENWIKQWFRMRSSRLSIILDLYPKNPFLFAPLPHQQYDKSVSRWGLVLKFRYCARQC